MVIMKLTPFLKYTVIIILYEEFVKLFDVTSDYRKHNTQE